MNFRQQNKKKIINDPVYGFINLPCEIIFDLIEHPFFQRLRRIKQLGLTHLVYPGALHTRFHHLIGSMNLMMQAVDVLRSKGNDISDDEALGAYIAILLHDIGHGPYSHTLEKSLVSGLSHEDLSLLFMKALRQEFGTVMNTAIQIFTNTYSKKFLHRLVSSQLDMDRLDYLRRDSFFTGVSEGVINTERIIKMLDVSDDDLVVEAKGIYSIDKFIVSRRLMYWQVYLHKTVLAAEHMLIKIIQRARFLTHNGRNLFTTSALKPFLYNTFAKQDFETSTLPLEFFSRLDDFDIFSCIKEWAYNSDKILSYLCNGVINRQLFRTEILTTPPEDEKINNLKQRIAEKFDIDKADASYLLVYDKAHNSAYNLRHDRINIVFKDGSIKDYSQVSDQINSEVLLKTVTRYFICYPKQFDAPGQF